MPDGVPDATETTPVAGLRLTPALADGVTIVSATFDKVTGPAPFSVSLVKTFKTDALPTIPLTDAALSSTATIGAASTPTVTVAVSQLVGLRTSQIS